MNVIFFNYLQLIQELKKENFDLKLRLYMEQKEREVSERKLFSGSGCWKHKRADMSESLLL